MPVFPGSGYIHVCIESHSLDPLKFPIVSRSRASVFISSINGSQDVAEFMHQRVRFLPMHGERIHVVMEQKSILSMDLLCPPFNCSNIYGDC